MENKTKPFILHLGDCIAVMRGMADNSVDAVVTDPPYGISFMGKAWDGADIVARTERRRGFASHAPDAGPNGGHKSIAAEAGKYDLTPAAMRAFQDFSEEWAREAFRVLKPGGHLLSFSSARTYHRMTSGIEDAGFEVRDQIMWVYGSGFPKSLDVSKAIDKAAGAVREMVRVDKIKNPPNLVGGVNNGGGRPWQIEAAAKGFHEVAGDVPVTDAARQWEGWGTALKPAHDPICVARKPLIGTVAANVLAHGTGALNIDGCRVDGGARPLIIGQPKNGEFAGEFRQGSSQGGETTQGRWPANLILSYNEDEFALRSDTTPEQLIELQEWINANP